MDKWKDISAEFDAVKDTKTQGWQKQKKFSEIFSNAYHLDPLIASFIVMADFTPLRHLHLIGAPVQTWQA